MRYNIDNDLPQGRARQSKGNTSDANDMKISAVIDYVSKFSSCMHRHVAIMRLFPFVLELSAATMRD